MKKAETHSYHEEIYVIWKNGCAFLDEKFYKSSKVLKLKKSDYIKQFKNYKLVRFLEEL